jgi:protein TonB
MLKALILSGALLLTAYAQDASAPATAQEGPAPNPPAKIIRVSEGVSQARIKTKVAPTYPDEALKKRIQGKVIFVVRVDKQGNVSAIRVVAGRPELVDSAMDAVRQWKYEPIALNGEIIEMETQVTVEFKLKKK